jgi:hypothetical protein
MMGKLAHMNVPLTLHGDPEELLREAPLAVDKFFPGHWELMQRLELQARPVVEAATLEDVVDFLGDVAFLKQPYRVNRDEVRADLRRWPDKIAAALGALRTLDRLDYEAMGALARLPGFGLQGGRAFSSAV